MSSILQIWDIGEPQCPICDGPLAYYTNDGEDEPSQHNWGATEKLDPCGNIECCQCAWEYFTTDDSESGVLDKLFARVRQDRLSVYKFRNEEEK